jgi:ATP-dependent helicase/nuclease subunit A
MPAPERHVCDQEVRDRVTGDLRTTYLVEAGAGTGKTRVLVDRYVRCVLDPSLGTGDVSGVAAITFTEKAAGELRQRVREEFEARELRAAPGSAEGTAVARALAGLDDAPISTIHSFAARLLREFPVPAGVDPAFEQLDELASGLERSALWEEWLGQLAAGDGAGDDPRTHDARLRLARLLRAGVRLDHVRALAIGAKGYHAERYDVDPPSAPDDAPDLGGELAALLPLADELAAFCATACTRPDDRGLIAATELVEAVRVLCARPPADLDGLAAALAALPAKAGKSAPGGAKANWGVAYGGKDELQRLYGRLVTGIGDLRDAHAEYLTGLGLAVAAAFSQWASEVELRLGRLDFTDLLGRLRDLLVNDPDARGALQRRFRYILVDEFQDTDPLQAEIAFYLCEREPRAGDWRRVELEPGKLFIVGDPKQSIYRFRRADISLYDEVKRLVAAQPGGSGVVTAIRQNFRTTPAVVAWVNEVFAGVFDGDACEGRQPRYQPVEAYRPAADGPGVAVLLGREYEVGTAGESDAARRDEARAVAALLLEMCAGRGERWVVRERAADGGAEASRPPRWGEVALLYRSGTGLETCEQALREAGVPYRVEGGKTYFERREVADALLCLRAADDPTDGPAVYGALHSSLFGFSDEDLVAYWTAGGRFGLHAPAVPGHEALAAALDVLRDLHERRGACAVHELVARLLRVCHAREMLAATGRGAPQALANLDKLVERARAFTDAGGGGLGAFLAWAAEAGDAAGEQESQPDDTGDVVHLLTIHKAKGLEFPIVVLIGGALGGGGGGGEPIVDRAARRLHVKLQAALPGTSAGDLEPRAYVALKEREAEMEASERRRLLYVAATRARDALVLTLFGKLLKKDGEPAAGALLPPLAVALPVPGPTPAAGESAHGRLLVLPPRAPEPPAESDAAPDLDALLVARAAWRDDRASLLAGAARPAPATSPSSLEHVDDEVRAGGPGAPSGRATALALGTAVHRVLELCDLADEGSLPTLAAAVARELGRDDLAGPVAALAAACWRSAPVRAAAASPEVYREVPVGVLVDGAVVSGAVDLLYRRDESWVVVDYKTDRDADPAALRERYAPQGAAYALAVEAATGAAVAEVVFVAASADGAAVVLPVDEALRARARTAVRDAVRAGQVALADEVGEGATSTPDAGC